MEITAIQKNIHNSPRKMRLIVDMVKTMKPSSAVSVLQFTHKAAALPVSKAIRTVLANAKVQNADLENISFKSIEVNEGLKLKRYRAGTKGRIKPYRKRLSQIKIVLTDEIKEVKSQKLEVKKDKSVEKEEGGNG